MFQRTIHWIAVLTVALSAATACAQEATLQVGSPAPKLSIAKWLKGDPVEAFKPGEVYVVEFWATWCGPCRPAISHVSSLQKRFPGKVTVVAVNAWENNPAGVEPFVKDMDAQMECAVGIDEVPEGQREGATAKAWMRAAAQKGIPTAFIVNKEGNIAWIGNPMVMDRPLAQVIDGSFDAAKEAELNTRSTEIASEQKSAFKAKEFDKVIELADKMIQEDPSAAPQQNMLKLRALYGKADWAAGNDFAAKLLDQHGKDADALRQLAWTIMRAKGEANPTVALAAAQQAQQVSDGGWAGKSVLAQAYFATADFRRAVDTQQEVVDATEGPMKEYQQRVLEMFKAATGKK